MDEQKEHASKTEHALTDDDLEHVVGGGLLSSPLGTPTRTQGIQGSGAPRLADVPEF